LYSAGVAAIEGKRYDSLASVFYTVVGSPEQRSNDVYFAEAISEGMLALTRMNVFNKLPGHEKNFVPLSEYLFKILQPKLDDLFLGGKHYERSFDCYVVMLPLPATDLNKPSNHNLWGPSGRFAWNHRHAGTAPLQRVLDEAKSTRERCGPIRAGLFGGSVDRF